MFRFLLMATLLVLFLLEGTVAQLLLPNLWAMSWEVIPRFALVGTIIVSLFLGRREGLYFGMSFGFLHDILYNQVIGVHALTMMVASYFAGLVLLLFHRNIVVVFTTVAIVLFGHEWLLHSLYRLFSQSQLDIQWTLSKQILPTVCFNLLFALLVYAPLSRLCERIILNREKQME